MSVQNPQFQVVSNEKGNIPEGLTFAVVEERVNQFNGVRTLKCKILEGSIEHHIDELTFQLRRSTSSDKWTMPSACKSFGDTITVASNRKS